MLSVLLTLKLSYCCCYGKVLWLLAGAQLICSFWGRHRCQRVKKFQYKYSDCSTLTNMRWRKNILQIQNELLLFIIRGNGQWMENIGQPIYQSGSGSNPSCTEALQTVWWNFSGLNRTVPETRFLFCSSAAVLSETSEGCSDRNPVQSCDVMLISPSCCVLQENGVVWASSVMMRLKPHRLRVVVL